METLANLLLKHIIIVDEYFVRTIKLNLSLPNLDANIKNAYDVLGHDLDLTKLNMEYTDLMKHNVLESYIKYHCLNWYNINQNKKVKNITVLIVYVITIKLHSAYVKCLISKRNILKSIKVYT